MKRTHAYTTGSSNSTRVNSIKRVKQAPPALTLTTQLTNHIHPYNESGSDIPILAKIKAPATSSLLDTVMKAQRDPSSILKLLQSIDRSPIEVVAVIDKSGSMKGDPLRLVQKTLRFFLELLRENDRLNLTTFETTARCEMSSRNMDEIGKKEAQSVINSLYADGGTNIFSGLSTGLNTGLPDRQNLVFSVFLFTDGQDCTTSSDIDTLQVNSLSPDLVRDQIFEEYYLKAFGGAIALEVIPTVLSYLQPRDSQFYTINTFGFGAWHNEKLLRHISESKSGLYHFMENQESIATVFAECIGGLITAVAQNMILKVVPAQKGVVIKKICTALPVKKNQKGEYLVEIGDIQEEESKDLVVLVDFEATNRPRDNYPLVNFVLEYTNVITSRYEEERATAVIRRDVHASPAVKSVETDIEFHRTRIEVINILKLGLANNTVIESVNLAVDRLEKSPNREQFKEFAQDLRESINIHGEANQTSKILTTLISSHSRQRSSRLTSSSQTMYGTNVRRMVQLSFRQYMQKKYQEMKQTVVCETCGQVGHFKKDCPLPRTTEKTSQEIQKEAYFRKKTQCLVCQQYGHFARECPKSAAKKKQALICYQCKQEGHHASECPNTLQLTPTFQQQQSEAKVRVKGLPFKGVTEQTIRDFFEGFNVLGVELLLKNGEAYVRLDTRENARRAKTQLDRKYIGSRFVNIDDLSK